MGMIVVVHGNWTIFLDVCEPFVSGISDITQMLPGQQNVDIVTLHMIYI